MRVRKKLWPGSPHGREYRRLREMLIETRKAAGLTQSALAKRLGRDQSFVSKYERGERRIDVVEFLAIAKALRADPGKLLRRLQGAGQRGD